MLTVFKTPVTHRARYYGLFASSLDANHAFFNVITMVSIPRHIRWMAGPKTD
jgi:hypothetical protein